jgi:predicted small metal-binding protein
MIMKMLSCKDMGMDDDFVARGETEQEVMDKMMKHAREMHSDKMMGKTNEEMMEMQNMMKMKMKDAMAM